MEKISKLWTTRKIIYHTYVAHATRCVIDSSTSQWFEDIAFMPIHHWKDTPEPKITKQWPCVVSRGQTLVCAGALLFAVYKHPQAINALHEYRPGCVRLLRFCCGYCWKQYYCWTWVSNHFSTVRFAFEEKRQISCVVTDLRQISRIFNFVVQ